MSASVEGEKPRDNRYDEALLSAAEPYLHRAEKGLKSVRLSGPEGSLNGTEEKSRGAVIYTQG